MPTIRSAVLLVALCGSSPAVASAQDVSTGDLLRDATGYVLEFIDRFANVVAEERYQQEAEVMGGAGFGRTGARMLRRRLRSELLLVKRRPEDPWVVFRDVIEVNGEPVEDRSERLADLFLRDEVDEDLAVRLAREGSRYHLDGADRSIDNPLAALVFLQPYYQWRFQFELDGPDDDVGPDVWILEFAETAEPPLGRDATGQGLPAAGRFWVERGTGRVLRSELVVGGDRIESRFAFDEDIGVAVPTEMRDRHSRGQMDYRGRATYGRFRRFSVSTTEEIP